MFTTSAEGGEVETSNLERILIVSSDDLWRTSAVGMACRPNRQIRGVADVLGAISVLLTEPEPIDIILVAPPLDVFTSGEFGKQLRRICPGASLALLEAFPEPEDCAPFHEIYDRPDDADRLERLICLLSEERLTTKSR